SQGGGVRSDGSLLVWGENAHGACDVPSLPPGMTYTKIALGGYAHASYVDDQGYTLGLRSDGTVLAWGSNNFGVLNVPALPGGLTYTDIGAGYSHCAALRSDGSLVAWGTNTNGQCNVPALPSGLSYVEVSVGGAHTVARRSDGVAISWGDHT